MASFKEIQKIMGRQFTIRSQGIYISDEVFRFLRVLCKVENRSASGSIITADEIADSLLKKVIASEYPELMEYQSGMEETEQKMIDAIQERKRA